MYAFIMHVIYWKSPMVLGLADRPLTPDLVVECLNNLDVESALLPPSIIEEMSYDDRYVDCLKKVKFVLIGGGLLTTPILNSVARADDQHRRSSCRGG